MMNLKHRHSFLKCLACDKAIFGLVLFFVLPVFANEQDMARLNIGFSLFRASLIANENLSRHISKENTLDVLLVSSELDRTDDVDTLLIKKHEGKAIGGLPVRIFSIDIEQLKRGDEYKKFAGIYIASPLSHSQRLWLIQFAKRHKVVLFSPFDNDVELGVSVGLHISSRISPAVNLAAIEGAELEFKRYFLKVAKKHVD